MTHQDDEINDLQWLLLEWAHIEGCDATKRMMQDKLRSLAGRRLYLARSVLEAPEHVAAARAMLDAGCSVPLVRDRLIVAGHCPTRRSAYRVISAALLQRGADKARSIAARLKEGGNV